MDPDPGGPKTCGSGGSGFGSATLILNRCCGSGSSLISLLPIDGVPKWGVVRSTEIIFSFLQHKLLTTTVIIFIEENFSTSWPWFWIQPAETASWDMVSITFKNRRKSSKTVNGVLFLPVLFYRFSLFKNSNFAPLFGSRIRIRIQSDFQECK